MTNPVREQIDDLLLFNDAEALKLLDNMAKKHDIPQAALEELLAWERAQQIRKIAYGRTEMFDKVLDHPDYWGNTK